MNEFDQTISDIKSGSLPWENLVSLTRDTHQSIRGAAIYAMGKFHSSDPRTVELLYNLAKEERNHERFMGTITLAQACVKLLNDVGSDKSQKAVVDLLEWWPESDREDLDWFLQHG